MTNPTTPFSWQMPTSTDLVTDLPADFETFGQAVATSMADLLGGTTGQVLSKASNTDMDFTWVAQDDSNAIQNAIVDAKGDLITATAADTPARLAVGTNGQTLVADSSTATGLKWAAPGGSASGLTLVKAQTIGTTVSSVTVTNAFSSTYDNYLILVTGGTFSTSTNFYLQLSSATTNYYQFTIYGTPSSNTVNGEGRNGTDNGLYYAVAGTTTSMYGQFSLFGPNLAQPTGYSTQSNRAASNENVFWGQGMHNTTTQHTAFTLTTVSGTATGGTIAVYGYQKS